MSIDRYGDGRKTLRLRINGWDDHNFVMEDPKIVVKDKNGSIIASSIDELSELPLDHPLDHHDQNSDQRPMLKDGWIHGDGCRATILKCEPHINQGHESTGKCSPKEMHFDGLCVLTLQWDYLPSCGPTGTFITDHFTLVATADYTKFMWDPRNCSVKGR